jgi:hypothetical protein
MIADARRLAVTKWLALDMMDLAAAYVQLMPRVLALLVPG